MCKKWRTLLALVLTVAVCTSVPSLTYAAETTDLDAILMQRGYPQIALESMDDNIKERIIAENEEFAGGVIRYFDEDGIFTEVQINADGSYSHQEVKSLQLI